MITSPVSNQQLTSIETVQSNILSTDSTRATLRADCPCYGGYYIPDHV